MAAVDISNIVVLTKSSGFEVEYDTPNLTKLYDAICNEEWDLAIEAVKEHPDQAQTWVVRYAAEDDDIGERELMWRFLPIHSACARKPPASVISALLDAFPEGANFVDDRGMYPLHYACGNQASREVIRLLILASPKVAKIADSRGMLPIHYLASWGPSSVSVIDIIMVANRQVGSVKDGEGNTPLDLALQAEYPERDVVVGAICRWTEATIDEAPSMQSPIMEASPFDEAPSMEDTSRQERQLAIDTFAVDEDHKEDPKENEEDPALYQATADVDVASNKSPRAWISFPLLVSSLYNQANKVEGEIQELKEHKKEKNSASSSIQSELSDAKEALKDKDDELETKEAIFLSELEEVKSELKSKTEELEAANKAMVERESELVGAKTVMEARHMELEELKASLEEKEATWSKQLQEADELNEASKKELSTVEEALKACEDERDDLRQTLTDVTSSHDRYKKKAENIDARFGALAASLESMSEDHKKLKHVVKARDEKELNGFGSRRAKLEEMLEMEKELEEFVTKERNESAQVYENQTKELEAISAVVAALRF